MNLWDIKGDHWDHTLLSLTADGAKGGVSEMAKKLGEVERTHGKPLGAVSNWFVERYGFDAGMLHVPWDEHCLISLNRMYYLSLHWGQPSDDSRSSAETIRCNSFIGNIYNSAHVYTSLQSLA